MTPEDRAEEAIVGVTSAMAEGERRDGQIEMARAVAETIRRGSHLVVEAGTGTGKSLGYLVPAVLSGHRVVVATATLALQDQLVGKDLPFLAEHIGRRVGWALLKGRSNYLCLQRAAEARRALSRPEQMGLGGLDPGGTAAPLPQEQIRDVLAWADTSGTGDRAELDFEPSPRAWGALSVSSRDCPGASKCAHGGDCFAERARTRAADADVVVVNLHLYALHLIGGQVLLPPHEVTVIDEVHQLEDIVAATAGLEMGAGRIRTLGTALGAVIADDDLAERIDAAAEQLQGALADAGDGRLRKGPGSDLTEALVRVRDAADRALAALRAVPDKGGDDPDLTARTLRAVQAATAVVDDIDRSIEGRAGDVVWIEGPGDRPQLRVAPVAVRETLAPLWDDHAVILTSATVPTTLAERLGLDAHPHRALSVGSPFDYEEQALLYCAAHLPDPRDARYEQEAWKEIESLVVAAGGRTLALFTSRRAMREAAAHLTPRLPWVVLRQDDLPRPALLRMFTEDEESCLFATMSFWQGVDVPGPSLRLVTIDRLPFPRPDEPLLQARREHARADAFRLVDLPRAATLLAQGTGRLIRTASDHGVVAVLDPRLATNQRYRWDLVRALPPMRRTRERSEAEAFLRSLRDGANP